MKLSNVKTVTKPSGTVLHYYRASGCPLIRLPSLPVDSEEFRAAWRAARDSARLSWIAPQDDLVRRCLGRALTKAASRARDKGRDVFVTLGDLQDIYRKQRGRCALTGLPLALEGSKRGGKRNPWALSIDRIDSDGGYVPGNVQLTTTMANMAKGEFSVREFRRMCRAAAGLSERDETLATKGATT